MTNHMLNRPGRVRTFWVVGAVVVALLAGCSAQSDESEVRPAVSLPSNLPSAVPPAPNFLGDWSVLAGNFSLFRMTTHLSIVDNETGESAPYPGRCLRPFLFDVDPSNGTIRISKNIAAHPTDPGPMRVIYVNEAVFAKNCLFAHLVAFNEDMRPSYWCTRGLTDYERESVPPWSCNIAIDYSTRNGFLWENVTFLSNASVPESYDVVFNGEQFLANQTLNFTVSAQHPTQPEFVYTGQAVLEPLGIWNYTSIRRF